MIKIGITGQSGFIGKHLSNFLALKNEEVVIIPFKKIFFTVPTQLENFVRQCDIIVHLAALDRHSYPQMVYETNMLLVKQLISAMDEISSKPHVIFASSIHEVCDDMFGRSKRDGSEMLLRWAEKKNALFTGLVIPNVFGPFCCPYYNSVIATFCYQVTHDKKPMIEIDAVLKLIYIDELVKIFYKAINRQLLNSHYTVSHTYEKNVTEILEQINRFKLEYFYKGIIPVLHNNFEINLFNTFRSYIDFPHHYPVKLVVNNDYQGTSTVEAIKTHLGGEACLCIIKPNMTQGNHFHSHKFKRIIVIKGKAKIQLRQLGTLEVLNFDLNGSEPSFVDIPIWYTHSITNTGKEDLYLIFWINEFNDSNDQDTFYEEVVNHQLLINNNNSFSNWSG